MAGLLDPPAISRAQAEARYAPLAMRGHLVPIADRVRPPFNSTGNVPNTPVSNGTNLGGTAREQVVIQQSAHGLVIDFSNWYNGGNETAVPNAVPVKVYLELGASALIPVTFGGQQTVTLGSFIGKIRSDVIGVSVTKGQIVYIRTFVGAVTAGQKYQLMRSSRGTGAGEGLNVSPAVAGPGTDATTATFTADAAGLTGLRLPGPSAILATPNTPAATVLAVTDSIGSGTGEDYCYGTGTGYGGFTSANLDMGWINRALNGRWSRLVVGMSGITSSLWTANFGFRAAGRKQFVDDVYFTHVISTLGINDLNGGTTLAAMQALKISEWQDLASRGRPVYQTTLPPFVSTTDNFVTVAGQSTALPAGGEAYRTQFNDWVRDGTPITLATMTAAATGSSGAGIVRAGAAGHPLTGYLEIADAVESARNSGKWAVLSNARKLTDVSATASSGAITSASAAFTSTDIGLMVTIAGAGASGGLLTSWIASVQSGTQATLATGAFAATTVTNAATSIGVYGITKDGIHPSGDWGASLGGHQLIANAAYAALTPILGAQTA